jgi:hypothetical protein
MKTTIAILLSLILTLSANAQSKNSMVYGNALKKYKKMEITGTVLTIIGGVALFTGNIMYRNIYNDHDKSEPPEEKVDMYRFMMYGGVGLMAVGIPLWAVGKAKERHIRIDAGLVRFKGVASANGVEFRIRF